MDDLNKEIVTAEPEVKSATPEPIQASPQPVAQPPIQEEVFDYTKDERTKSAWLNKQTKAFDTNLLYKSYRNAEGVIEKKYKPLQVQADSFTKLFESYGMKVDINEVKQALEDLKSFKDPENPVIKRGNYFSYFYDNPEYKPEVETFFENMRKKEIRKQFGEGVSDEIVSEIIANREYRQSQEAKEKAKLAEDEHKKLVGTIEDGWKEIEKETKAIGFPVNEEIRQKLLDICMKEQVDPRFMYFRFLKEYKKEIDQHQRARIQADLTKTQIKNHKAGIIPGSSAQVKAPQSQGNAKPSMVDRVLERVGLQKTT